MNKLLIKEDVKIENMIYYIRNVQVILDRDLAKLYGVETRAINQSVKRNIERFPIEFCFQMTEKEFLNWKSQFVTSTSDKIGLRRPPYVFTEQGVAMLSALLRSEIAIQTSIEIINAFVVMRKYLSNNAIEKRLVNVETKLINHDNRIDEIFVTLNNYVENNKIFFEGQIYDAYSLMLDIFNKSKNSIIIIDNYVDKNLLDILTKTNKEVIVITNKYNNEDYSKYKKQYNNVKLIINNTFHDRFIIIDKKLLYHSGASFKDLGKKCFAITKIEEANYLEQLLKMI